MADHPNLPQAPSNHPPPPPLLQTDARGKPPAARRLGLALPPSRATGAATAAVVGSASAPQCAPVKKPTKKRAPKVLAATGSCTAKKATTAAVSAHPHQAPVVVEPFLPPPAPPAARTPPMGGPSPPQLDSTTGACIVLDQMHASMDDESFNFTCGPSQEFTQNDVDAQSQEFAQEDSIIGDGDGIVGDGDGEGNQKRKVASREKPSICFIVGVFLGRRRNGRTGPPMRFRIKGRQHWSEKVSSLTPMIKAQVAPLQGRGPKVGIKLKTQGQKEVRTCTRNL